MHRFLSREARCCQEKFAMLKCWQKSIEGRILICIVWLGLMGFMEVNILTGVFGYAVLLTILNVVLYFFLFPVFGEWFREYAAGKVPVG